LQLLGGAALGSTFARSAYAEDYPTRSIRLIVPFSAGGGVDVFARAFCPHIGAGIGPRFVIENRPGSNTVLATQTVAQAAPDGYTLLEQTNSLTINPVLPGVKLPYDTLGDLVPISLIGRMAHLLVVNNDVPAHSVADLIKLAKAQPGKLNYGTGGGATTNNIAAVMFQKQAGIKLVHVPYKGASEYINDILAGNIQLVFAGGAQGADLAKAGKVRALATTGKNRVPELPNVPTMAEAGFPGFEIYSWHGMLAPTGTPEAVISLLATEIRKAVNAPAVKKALGAYELIGSTPAEFGDFLRSEIKQLAPIGADLMATQ
jgi:tripartite-type tricarboxylate transporter receptor subunit TctC